MVYLLCLLKSFLICKIKKYYNELIKNIRLLKKATNRTPLLILTSIFLWINCNDFKIFTFLTNPNLSTICHNPLCIAKKLIKINGGER